MSTISAGQICTWGEQRAMQASYGSAAPATFTSYVHLTTDAQTGVFDNTWTVMTSPAVYAATGYSPVAHGALTGPSAASPSVVSNAATITWGPTSSSPGTTINWGVLSDLNTPLASCHISIAYKITTPRTPISGDSIQAAIGAFTAQV